MHNKSAFIIPGLFTAEQRERLKELEVWLQKKNKREAVKAAPKQSGSLLQYKSTMWGVIAHRPKKLLSHAGQEAG